MGGLYKIFMLNCVLVFFTAGVLSLEDVVAKNISLEFNKFTVGATAFTIVLDREMRFNDGETLKFTRVLNDEGHGYNPGTGVFTAPRTGIYIFSFQIEHWDTRSITAHLMKDRVLQSSAVITPAGKSAQSTGTVIITVHAGQQVYLTSSGGVLFGSASSYVTSFSGAFLY